MDVTDRQQVTVHDVYVVWSCKTSASVPFCNGVGETEDPYLIQWFKDHGYEVEETPEKASKEAVEKEEKPAKEKNTLK